MDERKRDKITGIAFGLVVFVVLACIAVLLGVVLGTQT